MDNPALAFLFVFLFFLAPVLLSAIPFLFFYIVYAVSARTVDPVDTAPLSPDPAEDVAHSMRARAFQLADGYMRLAGKYLAEESRASWQPGRAATR